MHYYLYLLFAVFAWQAASAQTTLYIPRNLSKAYENGTRSWDGKPGPKYWQNRAKYAITASLAPDTRQLTGSEVITYTNNSPDSLRLLRLKLQHDRYRKGAQRSSDVAAADVSDEGTRITTLTYNGTPVAEKKRRRYSTFLDIELKETPLLPGQSATLQVDWSYTLPADAGADRECVCDSTTFFVPYWYPQVAVYDDLQGWASYPYTGQQEFYHDFADYEVRLTLPAGFQAWATGTWQNAAEILTPPYLKRWQDAQQAQEVVKIFSEKELKEGGVYRGSRPTTFHFVATDVPDFAFAASDHYNWDATSVVVDDRTQRRTFVSAAYNTSSTDYPQVARIAADGIRLMSTWLPGYPFPYPVMTVFNGNDGMEYPMMCNDVSTAPRSPMTLTIHEVSHTYFPFMMGINEQHYAWMDEGWASFFDYMLSDSLSHHTLGEVRGYGKIAGTDNDVPPMVKSHNLTSAYRNASYQRPQIAYVTLLDVLGYETFHRCMTTYMDRWKSKHPAPFDFFQTWNEASRQNLDWFWRPWFFEWGYPDVAIAGVTYEESANCSVIHITRHGHLPIPVHAELEYTDGSRQTLHQSAAVWKDGKHTLLLKGAAGKSLQSVKLGKKDIPDSVPDNNLWHK